MKKYSFRFAPKYSSSRFKISTGVTAAYVEDAPKPALTTELFLKELGTIKSALEANQNKKFEDQDKNWEDKLKAANDLIADLQAKAKANEATTEVIEKLKADFDVQTKAFDLLQGRWNKQSMQVPGTPGSQEDLSLKGVVAKTFATFKNNIESGKIAKGDNDAKMVFKAVGDMSVVASVNTGVVPNTYRDGIIPPPNEMVHLRNLVAVSPSATDSYHFYRFSQGEGNIGYQVQELATKNQIDEDMTETVVNLDYLAGWLRISRKMLRNFTGLQSMLSRWLPEQYYQAEDTKGYQVLIAQATGVGDSSGTDIISQIIRTIGLQKKAKYNVNGIVVDGAVWAKILTYKASTSGEFTQPIGVVTITPAGQLMICGIPLYTSAWVGGDEAIIGDWRFFEIIQSEALSLQFFEQDGTNVRENKITARIEASVGFAMLDPKAFAILSLESVS